MNEKQRCNDCMAVFDEELTACPNCGRDDCLMFPIPHFFAVLDNEGGDLVSEGLNCTSRLRAELALRSVCEELVAHDEDQLDDVQDMSIDELCETFMYKILEQTVPFEKKAVDIPLESATMVQTIGE